MVTTHSLEHPPDKTNMNATTKRTRMSTPMQVSSSVIIRTARREAEMKAKQNAVLTTLRAEMDKAVALHVANMEAEYARLIQAWLDMEARAIKELQAKHVDTVEGRAAIAAFMAIMRKTASPVVSAVEMSAVEEAEESAEMNPVVGAVAGAVESAEMNPEEWDEEEPVESAVEDTSAEMNPVEWDEEEPVESAVEDASAEMNPMEWDEEEVGEMGVEEWDEEYEEEYEDGWDQELPNLDELFDRMGRIKVSV